MSGWHLLNGAPMSEATVNGSVLLEMSGLDYILLFIYFAFVIGIGVAVKRSIKSSEDFLQAGRSLPAWIAGLAFISANLGAIEILGFAANGAQYGWAIGALLLDRRHPRHGLPRRRHDAVLLRLQDQIGARVPEGAATTTRPTS